MAKISLLPQYKVLKNENRYTIVTGGRGSAKSFHVSVFLLLLTYQKDEVILFTRYTMTSARKSIIPEFREKIELMGVEDAFIVKDAEIENRYTGSKIMFSGIKTSSGNQTANLKSITGLTCWVLDEAEEMVNEDEFDRIDQSIRKAGKHNRVIIVMNPCEKQHFIYKRFFQSGQAQDTTYIHTTYLDNKKNLAEGFVRIAEREKVNNVEKYNRQYLGHWGSAVDLVFPSGFDVYDSEPDADSIDWIYYGGDFGFSNDPTTIIQATKQGRNLYLKEMLWLDGLTNSMIGDHIKGLNLQDDIIVFDSAEPKSIKDLQIQGCRVVKARKGVDSVHYGIQRLYDFDIHIHKDSKNLQNEFELYKWKRNIGTGEYLRNSKGHKVPVDADNHGIDATRYVISYFYAE